MLYNGIDRSLMIYKAKKWVIYKRNRRKITLTEVHFGEEVTTYKVR